MSSGYAHHPLYGVAPLQCFHFRPLPPLPVLSALYLQKTFPLGLETVGPDRMLSTITRALKGQIRAVVKEHAQPVTVFRFRRHLVRPWWRLCPV